MNKLRRKITSANANSNIDADKFNSYFSSISNSSNYIEPTHKLSAPHNINYITSSTVYYIFNKSCPEGTGSDDLPGWFLKLISPAICEPCRPSTTASSRHFFQLSGNFVLFTLLKKYSNQYHPISITPILSRILEKYIVKDHIYPCLTNSLIKSNFDDQFGLRPTGLPT